ncbi:sigma factor [Nitratireductor aestuarii]|uniref:Sigma factor n=1 Tax=Nitratireductor aestuarii TaxID=1735103 RepID=A0A916RD70_9HYPH|nr:RNA polymerase sigma factor SigJ [Nitratireductor aestuarii]GGA51372.1 sigma factor [Nitratireductor aestuarii]
MEEHDLTSQFEAHRTFLIGLAYRILGTFADAEDAVQDTFVKWHQADRTKILNPPGWLTATCTRRCIDILQSAQHTRVQYFGSWLPEPVQLTSDDNPEAGLELSSSLSVAFLLVLERLAPKERAAYLLHEIFDQPYADVAAHLGIEEAACRKLVSRARTNIGREKPRNRVPRERQRELLDAFRSAVSTGRTEQLAALMSGDIELRADGGGRVPTQAAPIFGGSGVLTFIRDQLSGYWAAYDWRPTAINGALGALLLEEGRIAASVSFAYDDGGSISGIYITRNPEKLSRLDHMKVALQ